MQPSCLAHTPRKSLIHSRRPPLLPCRHLAFHLWPPHNSNTKDGFRLRALRDDPTRPWPSACGLATRGAGPAAPSRPRRRTRMAGRLPAVGPLLSRARCGCARSTHACARRRGRRPRSRIHTMPSRVRLRASQRLAARGSPVRATGAAEGLARSAPLTPPATAEECKGRCDAVLPASKSASECDGTDAHHARGLSGDAAVSAGTAQSVVPAQDLTAVPARPGAPKLCRKTVPRCQVEGCTTDLSVARPYHQVRAVLSVASALGAHAASLPLPLLLCTPSLPVRPFPPLPCPPSPPLVARLPSFPPASLSDAAPSPACLFVHRRVDAGGAATSLGVCISRGASGDHHKRLVTSFEAVLLVDGVAGRGDAVPPRRRRGPTRPPRPAARPARPAGGRAWW